MAVPLCLFLQAWAVFLHVLGGLYWIAFPIIFHSAPSSSEEEEAAKNDGLRSGMKFAKLIKMHCFLYMLKTTEVS